MNTKIFLNEFDSKKSVSNTNGLNVSLGGKRKLIPSTDASYVISAYEQYNKEREACNIIRLTCEVNPVCSNVLFNRISEVVKDEGCSGLTMLNYGFSGSENSACTESGYHIFDGVKYKEQSMEFWSGNTAFYQSVDDRVNTLSYGTTVSQAVKASSNNYDNGQCFDEVASSAITNAIRDMQLSKDDSEGKHFVYHCGLDIFNNHLIRSKTFKPVCKIKEGAILDGCDTKSKCDDPQSSKPYGAFNTIADVMRDVNGNKVVEKMYFPVSAQIDGNTKILARHLYEYDDIYSFEDAVENKLVEKYDGWFGFKNSSKIKSYDDFDTNESLGLERPIMYMNGGDFVDMYPSRDLYSFVPKWNEFKHKIEKNWNYCITYPSSSTTHGFDDIIETNGGVNSLKAIYFDENTRSDNGSGQLVIYGISKHGLSVGDYVNIYKTYIDESGGTITERVIEDAEVSAVADEYIFTVFADTKISDSWVEVTKDDIKEKKITVNEQEYILDEVKHEYFYRIDEEDNIHKYYIVNAYGNNYGYVNFDDTAQSISYKKTVGGIECDYYVRIFSRLPNFRFASGTTTEYDLYKNGSTMIEKYQSPQFAFESHVSRLAFAKNIYSDNVGEIVFTDNIDISNLKDNLGRPLSSVYLTLLKNNKGYKEWYGFTNNPNGWTTSEVSGDTIEFSHCFGKLTCGFELSVESIGGNNISNVKTINNSGINRGYDCSLINKDREYDPTSSGDSLYSIDDEEIWFDTDVHFYGDLTYYDGYNAIERHIQPIMHRFNSAQRESKRSASNDYFKSYVYDEIYNDDYDKNDKYVIRSYVVNNANDKNEGYYYSPHYEIPIKTFDKLNSIMPMFLTIRSLVNTEKGTRITCLQSHYLSVGDKAMIYDREADEYFYCLTIGGDGDKVFVCKIYDEDGKEATKIPDLFSTSSNISRYRLFKIDNLNIPSYARILKDGSCRFVWRNVVNNGMNVVDKSIEEYPFTNGAFYVNKKIDLFLRRQDPLDIYGLYSEDDIIGREMEIENENNYVKDKEITC